VFFRRGCHGRSSELGKRSGVRGNEKRRGFVSGPKRRSARRRVPRARRRGGRDKGPRGPTRRVS
jgi:hypothetical protein